MCGLGSKLIQGLSVLVAYSLTGNECGFCVSNSFLEDDLSSVWPSKGHLGGVESSFIQERGYPYFNPEVLLENSKLPEAELTDCMPMARLSRIAYCRNDSTFENWDCPDCIDPQVKDFKVYKKFFSARWVLFGFIGYFPSTNAKVIAFRSGLFDVTISSSLVIWLILSILTNLFADPLIQPEFISSCQI